MLASLSGGASYHLPVSFLVEGPLSTQRLEKAITAALSAHPALCIKFARAKGGRIATHAVPPTAFPLQQRRLAANDASALKTLISSAMYGATSFFDDPVCKFLLVDLGDDRHHFTFSLNHAVADGVSIGLFIETLSRCYNAPDAEPARPVTFAACVDQYQLRSGQWSEEESAFWRDALANVDDSARAPSDFSDHSYHRDAVITKLSERDFDAIAAGAQRVGVSVFQFFFAVYFVMLSRWTGSPEIAATFQSAGRRGKPETTKTVGSFSNALVVSADVRSIGFAEFARALRGKIFAAIDHERFPYHEVIRATGVHPKFGVNWYPAYEGVSFDGVTARQDDRVAWQSDYDLNLHGLTDAGGLRLKLHYDPTRFEATRIALFLEQMISLAKAFADAPDSTLDEPTLKTSHDDLLPSLESALSPIDATSTIAQEFLNQCGKTPDAIALLCEDEQLSFQALERRVRGAASSLTAQGVGEGDVIVLLADRNARLVVATLAASSVGAAFCVFDASYPESRLLAYHDVLAPDFLLDLTPDRRHERLASRFVESRRLTMNDNATPLNAPVDASPDRTAYFLFTSGTTGTPKCVRHADAPLLHFIKHHTALHGLGANDRYSVLGGLGHDPIMRDIFTPLLSGATCCIPSEASLRDPRALWRWLDETQVSVIHATPQMSKVIALGSRDGAKLQSIRRIFWGGDRLSKSIAKAFFEVAPHAEGTNFYGATETPQAVSRFEIGRAPKYASTPIGEGFAGAQLVVTDKRRRRVGFGEIGEICVRSNALSRGYTDEALNAEKFIALSRVDIDGYATGDLGFYGPSGETRFLGRNDDQIKVRGFRVEIAEIVKRMEAIDGVRTGVIASASRDGETILHGYYVADASCAADEVTSALARELPDYMTPSTMTRIDAAPLTPNGKIDYAALPTPESPTQVEDAFEAPKTDIEKAIAEEYARSLGLKRVGAQAAFAKLGGDSLSFINVSMALEDIIGAPPEGWEQMRIRDLAALARGRSWISWVETPVFIRAIAICAVVAAHFQLIDFSGAIGALLMVAGHSFARFQLSAIGASGRFSSIYSLVLKVAAPTVLFTLLVQIVFGAYDWTSVLLIQNLIDPHRSQGFDYWFVMVLLQNIAIIAIALSVASIRKFALERPFIAGLWFLAIAYSARLLGPLVWDTDYLFNRVPHMTLWLLALGWCVAIADTVRRKTVVAAAAIGLAVIEGARWGNVNVLLFTSTFAILAVARIPTPAYLNKLTNAVALSSLFIYLTHFQAKSLIQKFGVENGWLQFGFAIFIGILAYYAWEHGPRILRATPLGRRVVTRFTDR